MAPVDVASTVPKVAKAASLLRMAMASARAVSSSARRGGQSHEGPLSGLRGKRAPICEARSSGGLEAETNFVNPKLSAASCDQDHFLAYSGTDEAGEWRSRIRRSRPCRWNELSSNESADATSQRNGVLVFGRN